MDRLAHKLDDLRRLVRALTGNGVRVQFVTENLTFTGEDTAMATLLLSVMGAFAEFERAGFTGGLNRYRNVDRDWEDLSVFRGRSIDVPAMFTKENAEALKWEIRRQ